MKQIVLSLLMALSLVQLTAQDTIWVENFSRGLFGWDVNTLRCGNNTGPNRGSWQLSGVSVAGIPIPPEDIEVTSTFSILNNLEYTASFASNDGVDYGTVYSRYTLEGSTLVSQIDTAALNLGGVTNNIQANGIVISAANTSIQPESQAEARDLVKLFYGAGRPTITFANNGTQLVLSNGFFQFTYEKVSDCGDIWTWSPNGNYGFGVFNIAAGSTIQSASRLNGVASTNFVFQSSLGSTTYNPGSPPYPQYVTELISPVIDISAADRALEIEFTQAVAFLNTPTDAPVDNLGGRVRSSVSISSDGGQTWGPAINANPTLNPNQTRRNKVTFPLPSGDINGSDEIRLKFTFATDFYFWLLDDIVVKERVGYDMQVNRSFFAVAPNAVTPVSQTEDMRFLADIQNNGGLTANDVVLNLRITNATTGEQVYNANNPYGAITPDSLAENVFFSQVLPAASQTVGVYEGRYLISHSQPEDRTANDTILFQFVVNDTLFAKETGRTRGVAPAANNSYYYGNCFYMPRGDGYFARYFTFGVDNAAQLGGVSVNLFLYEWAGDVNGDLLANPDEYVGPVSINEYTFTGSEGQNPITVPIDFDGNSYPLSDDTYYLAVMQYVASADQPLFMSASEAYNYGATVFLTDSIDMPRYASVLSVGASDEPEFSTVGFGRGIVPVMRLSIGNNPDLDGEPILNATEPLAAENLMKVFPNPANELFTLDLKLQDMNDWAEIRLFDLSGRILFQRRYDNIQEGRFVYDVSQLTNGVYFLQLNTPNGARTERIVVQH